MTRAHLNVSDPKGQHGDTDLELCDNGGAVLFQEYGLNRSRVFLSAWQVANLAGVFRRHREETAGRIKAFREAEDRRNEGILELVWQTFVHDRRMTAPPFAGICGQPDDYSLLPGVLAP
ncbi:hypothetical protein ACW7BJ_33255 [Azospirillum argentinense]